MTLLFLSLFLLFKEQTILVIEQDTREKDRTGLPSSQPHLPTTTGHLLGPEAPGASLVHVTESAVIVKAPYTIQLQDIKLNMRLFQTVCVKMESKYKVTLLPNTFEIIHTVLRMCIFH